MPFGAEDKQAARFADLVRQRCDLALVLLFQLVEQRPCGEDLLVIGVTVTVRRFDEFGGIFSFTHFVFGEILGITAEFDIGTATRHIGGDGDRTQLTCLRDDERFALMRFGVEHFVRDAFLGQQFGDLLGFFNGDGAHQHRLLPLVAFADLCDHRRQLGAFGLVHHVGQIFAHHRLVGGDLHHVQPVDLLEFGLFRLGRTGHTGQFLVQTEIILEGDGRQRPALPRYLDLLLGFDGLMQTFVVPATVHNAAGELVNDQHLIILDDIIHVTAHHTVGFDGLVDVMQQGHVFGIHQIVHLKGPFRLLDALLGQCGGARLFIDDVIAVGGQILLLLGVHFLNTGAREVLDELIRFLIQVGGLVALTRHDERGTRFVNEDGVHLVDDGKGVSALHLVGGVDDHIIAQIIKSQFVVGAVGNIRGIGGATL